MKRVIACSHPKFAEHNAGPGHPERPERLDAIFEGLREQGLVEALDWMEPEEASEEALARVHDLDHVRSVLALRGKSAMIDADTHTSPSSVEAALRAAGGVCQTVKAVLAGEADSGFCLVRPPGHHAERSRSMGFCLFNNVAVAAAYAIAELGLQRVLIVDPDVHHGNGTQDIFYARGDVAFVSIHQWPFYPGTGAAEEAGEGEGAGTIFNVPLAAGAGDVDYLYATREIVVPLLRKFQPELVLFSAGFDAHEDDPLGGMRVTTAGFRRMYSVVLDAMEELGIPGVFSLEGGYSLDALRTSLPEVIDLLLNGGKTTDDIEAPAAETAAVVARVRAIHRLTFGV